VTRPALVRPGVAPGYFRAVALVGAMPSGLVPYHGALAATG
jgi:hypothetical protein